MQTAPAEAVSSAAAASEFLGGEYDEIDEELKELDESHDGKAEPQTEYTARVRDVLQQLTSTSHTP